MRTTWNFQERYSDARTNTVNSALRAKKEAVIVDRCRCSHRLFTSRTIVARHTHTQSTVTMSDSEAPLGWLVPFQLDTDDREPILVIAAGTFGVYAPSIVFWLQVFLLVALQCILSAMLSIWTYTLIIQQPTSFSRFLIGYGILIPLWLFLPKLQLQVFGIHNMLINFCLSGIIPTLNIFHTMEGSCVYKRVLGVCSMYVRHVPFFLTTLTL